MTRLADDLRGAWRLARRAPGPVAGAAGALAVGVAAGAPALALWRSTASRGAPYSDQLVGGSDGRAFHDGWTDAAVPLAAAQDSGLEVVLGILVALALVVVAAAAVDVALLLLSLASARRHEVAVRRALGAGSGRLASRLLAEAAAVCAAGVLPGVVLAAAVARFLGSGRDGAPTWTDAAGVLPVTTAMVAGFLAAATAAFWLATGLPALRVNLRGAMAGQGQVTAGPREGIARDVLAALQLAGSLALLVTAGLLLRTVPPSTASDGVPDGRRVVTLDLAVAPGASVEARRAAWEAVRTRAAALPGVEAAGLATPGARVGLGTVDRVSVLTEDVGRPIRFGRAQLQAVSAGWFEARGVEIVAGRGFDARDDSDAPPVAIVSRPFAQALRLGLDPVGRRVQLGGIDHDAAWHVIVGVADDVRARGIGAVAEPPAAVVYVPAAGRPPDAAGLAVRPAPGAEPGEVASALEDAMRGVDGVDVVGGTATLEARLDEFAAPLRWFGRLFVALALAAVLLAAGGLHATTAYGVARRTREVGTRVALGATRGEIVRMVLRRAARNAAIGLVLGLFAAIPLARLLQIRFDGVRPMDAPLWAGAAALLATIAVGSAWRPARRAADTEPAETLRAE